MTDTRALQELVRALAALEPELGRWAAAAIWRGLPPSRRRRIRDELLREAARRLPPGSVWQKSHALADLARRPHRPGVTTPAELVALASAVYCPGARGRAISAAQVFRVLAVSCIPPMELRVDEVGELNPLDFLVERTSQ